MVNKSSVMYSSMMNRSGVVNSRDNGGSGQGGSCRQHS